MLASQRALFDIPRDVAYFNAAGWGPIPKAVAEAGVRGAARKAQPWTLPVDFLEQMNERARAAAAGVINAEPGDVGLIPSVGYGVSTAAKILKVAKGTRVVVLENDHTAPVLEWMSRSEEQGFTIETVRQPADGDWTSAVLDAIRRSGALPVAVVSMSSVHWSDGAIIDIGRIAPAVREQGGALLVDATHGAGINDLDVKRLNPDFMMFPTYKWLLGPYGRAFLYVAKRHQEGIPLEQPSLGRRGVNSERPVYFADTRYVEGARRFDMGERDHFVSMEMAAVGIETVHGFGRAAVEEKLAYLTTIIAEKASSLGDKVKVLDVRYRAPQLICLGFPGGMPNGLAQRLATEKVYVAPRIGRLRISPHVYNDEEDVERLVAGLARALA